VLLFLPEEKKKRECSSFGGALGELVGKKKGPHHPSVARGGGGREGLILKGEGRRMRAIFGGRKRKFARIRRKTLGKKKLLSILLEEGKGRRCLSASLDQKKKSL